MTDTDNDVTITLKTAELAELLKLRLDQYIEATQRGHHKLAFEIYGGLVRLLSRVNHSPTEADAYRFIKLLKRAQMSEPRITQHRVVKTDTGFLLAVNGFYSLDRLAERMVW